MAKALGVNGLMNVQFAVKDGDVYVLEVNPRASRTVPFVAKATGVPVAKIATRVMIGENLVDFDLEGKACGDHMAVKEAVFPFTRFADVDTILGPEMKSTGEVMGLDENFPRAFAKSQIGAGNRLPKEGTAFISVKDRDKEVAAEIASRLEALGFKLIATGGTQRFMTARGLSVKSINKVLEGRPHCVDAILNGEVQLVITPHGAQAYRTAFPYAERL